MAETEKKPGHLQNIRTEFKKIIWPTKERALKQTGAVVAASVALGLLIAAIDYIFKLVLGLVL